MFSLVDEVALVTGAASGIGAATARCRIQQGAHGLLAQFHEQGDAVATALGANARFLGHGLACEERWQSAVDTVVSTFGRVDGLERKSRNA